MSVLGHNDRDTFLYTFLDKMHLVCAHVVMGHSQTLNLARGQVLCSVGPMLTSLKTMRQCQQQTEQTVLFTGKHLTN